MNIRDLKYLTTLAKTKHFGQAAEICHVSQPALSMQISKMEEFLGAALVERINKRVVITDTGLRVIEIANRILQDVERIEMISKNSADSFSGPLSMSAFPTLAPYFFSVFITRLIDIYPNLQCRIFEDISENIINKLVSGSLDIGFLSLPCQHKDLEVHHLFQEKLFLVVNTNHMLAQYDTVSFNMFEDETFLLLESGHCLRDQTLAICNLAKINENINIQATSIATLKEMIVANVGIGILPECAIKQLHPRLKKIDFQEETPRRDIGMVFRKSHHKKDEFLTLLEVMKDCLTHLNDNF